MIRATSPWWPPAARVRRYYDDHTRQFLALGQGTDGTIRRAVWGPGVASRAEAMAPQIKPGVIVAAFIAAAAKRFYDREPKVRTLA